MHCSHISLTLALQLFKFAKTYKGTYDGECPFYCSYSGYNVISLSLSPSTNQKTKLIKDQKENSSLLFSPLTISKKGKQTCHNYRRLSLTQGNSNRTKTGIRNLAWLNTCISTNLDL